MTEEKYFALLRLLRLRIKSFVNPFVDVALTFLIVHLIYFCMIQNILDYYQNLSYLRN